MAFTGRAIYNPSGVFDGVAEDVSDVIGIISPYETPLLDILGDAPRPAANVLHEWLEDELNPNTIVASSAITSLAAGQTQAIGVHALNSSGAVAPYLQAGAILKINTSGEYLQISAISGNTITVTRGFASTTTASLDVQQQISVIADAALEGADVTGDISRPRTRLSNYAQIFKKDVIVSGTVQSVSQLGGIANEFDYQKDKRIREAIRDLEKAAIQGKLSGNSIGSATAYRTMNGIWSFIATNVSTISSAGALTSAILDSALQNAWNYGGTDIDILVCDANVKKVIDSFNSTRVRTVNEETKFRNGVSIYESTFGTQAVVLCRWMPANSVMGLSSSRVKVLPLQGRSFSFQEVAQTGDARKGMVIGEYTVEVKNETGLMKIYA